MKMTALKHILPVLILFSFVYCKGKVDEPGDSDFRRIVSMVPSATETLFELGAGERVVGVCDQCLWPEEASVLPRLGSYLNPSTEMIMKLNPDVVFLYETQTQLAAALKERGISVIKISTESLHNLFGMIGKIGKTVEREEQAAELIKGIRAELEEIKSRRKVGKKAGVKTVVVVDRMSFALQRMFVAAGDGYVSQLIEIAGGDNCFGIMNVRYPMVSFEAVAACRPDVIIDIRPEGECDEEGKKRGEALWMDSGIMEPGGTVKKVAVIGPSPVTVPGPRVAESVKILYNLIHGE